MSLKSSSKKPKLLLLQRNTFLFLNNFISPIYSEGYYFKIIFYDSKTLFKNIVFGERMIWVLYRASKTTQIYIILR